MTEETVRKPWGSFRVIGRWSDEITVKILVLNPKSRLSLQRHKARDEEWLCLSGRAEALVGTKVVSLGIGAKTFVPRMTNHRLSTLTGAEILEVSYGDFDEDDIERIEDDYGRVG